MNPDERQSLIERRAELQFEIAKLGIAMRPMRVRREEYERELREIEEIFMEMENA